MKNIWFIFGFCLLSAQIFAQIPQPKSVTIDPNGTHIQDVQGNLKVQGITESHTVRASGLATGNPFIARPIYANGEGYLVTGYKVGYFSIPPVAFRLDWDVQSEGQASGLGIDIVSYDADRITSISTSSNKTLLAPLYFPHRSKLASIKITFYSYPIEPNSLIGDIVQAPLNEGSGLSTIFSFTTPTSSNSSLIVAEFPINLLEIDNQNYVYSLKLRNSANTWTFLSIRGVSIEYRDF
ncbi:hypothetical protein [Emticicia agri]|uniref:Uncharacterized protein n=1 Tax=Emticicia agri TaxID=2492393 RepID=A0A4Q5LYB2_9BACT|nr:hypothetical protein [Emticicia agri]RYU94788.1 hypothetical protein EWM59_14860 [Emticicia agri]